jgi:nucleotide-binding universal stress UspA family protein
MFDHILVPLDGSELAEAAIPPAVVLSEKLGSEVTLLHIIEENAPQEIHGQRHLTTDQEAQKYLNTVAAERFAQGTRIKTHVHSEEVSQLARSIAVHSAEFKPDLIILCAHGEGGLHDFVVGSIPQQVIAAGLVPVLLLQPESAPVKKEIHFEHFLVGLDGKPSHDTSLNLAAEFAGRMQARLHLIRIVPTLSTLGAEDAATGTLLPNATNAVLEMAEDEACDYLTEKLQALEQLGVDATAEVGRGDPAVEVVKSAVENAVDLIVLGTHGKKGMQALWAGSVAPRIVDLTRLPVLLVPVPG